MTHNNTSSLMLIIKHCTISIGSHSILGQYIWLCWSRICI